MINNDTIAAIATGLTDSGIGIIRISGNDSIKIANSLYRSPNGKKNLTDLNSHVLSYGYILNSDNVNVDWKDNVLDEVMIVVMKAPRSFTGENTVEIQCHGGVLVMKKILSSVLEAGARLAEPGEFTKRAFLNGRIDLTRAEAVIDVIHSQNEYALNSSLKQLQGKMYNKIKKLREKIIYEIAFIESALDDPEHISLDGYYDRLEKIINEIINEIDDMLSTADNGKIIKEGINTVIVGKPNAGKSSLMNLILGEERAIVTDIAGTTRDILKESVTMKGLHFNVTDTAGIRKTEDIVEKIGVKKAKQYANEADLILYVVDSSVELDENDKEIVEILNGKNIIILLNKNDLKTIINENDILKLFNLKNIQPKKILFVKTSAKDEYGMEEFSRIVESMFIDGNININNEIMITNMRHKEALNETKKSLEMVKNSICSSLPEDFLSIDLMSAYSSLGRIIGEEVEDDLINEIFSKFCMGK